MCLVLYDKCAYDLPPSIAARIIRRHTNCDCQIYADYSWGNCILCPSFAEPSHYHLKEANINGLMRIILFFLCHNFIKFLFAVSHLSFIITRFKVIAHGLVAFI